MDKYCRNCGNKMNETDRFCQKCGTDSQAETNPVQNNNVQQNSNAPASGKTSGMAVASFVCSMVGIVVMGLIMGILAVCFGAAALNRMKVFPQEGGKGLATAGIVVGIIEIVIMVFYICSVGRFSSFNF